MEDIEAPMYINRNNNIDRILLRVSNIKPILQWAQHHCKLIPSRADQIHGATNLGSYWNLPDSLLEVLVFHVSSAADKEVNLHDMFVDN